MRFCKILAVSVLVMTAFLVGTSSTQFSAWSLERSDENAGMKMQAANDDVCRPLLTIEKISTGPQKKSIDTGVVAGGAALGLFFGVHTAIGPREQVAPRKSYQASGVDSAYANAVARYRQCRSQQIIQSLASNS